MKTQDKKLILSSLRVNFVVKICVAISLLLQINSMNKIAFTLPAPLNRQNKSQNKTTCIKKYLTKTQKYANIKRYKIYCPLSVKNGIYAPNTRETGVFYNQWLIFEPMKAH